MSFVFNKHAEQSSWETFYRKVFKIYSHFCIGYKVVFYLSSVDLSQLNNLMSIGCMRFCYSFYSLKMTFLFIRLHS